ncbi:unnamed protein product [Amoebophrya sp. A120]|nr:unnamed protein product [Amoebophrya sp. A120]|eukprot:GSA120T00003917001.1
MADAAETGVRDSALEEAFRKDAETFEDHVVIPVRNDEERSATGSRQRSQPKQRIRKKPFGAKKTPAAARNQGRAAKVGVEDEDEDDEDDGTPAVVGVGGNDDESMHLIPKEAEDIDTDVVQQEEQAHDAALQARRERANRRKQHLRQEMEERKRGAGGGAPSIVRDGTPANALANKGISASGRTTLDDEREPDIADFINVAEEDEDAGFPITGTSNTTPTQVQQGALSTSSKRRTSRRPAEGETPAELLAAGSRKKQHMQGHGMNMKGSSSSKHHGSKGGKGSKYGQFVDQAPERNEFMQLFDQAATQGYQPPEKENDMRLLQLPAGTKEKRLSMIRTGQHPDLFSSGGGPFSMELGHDQDDYGGAAGVGGVQGGGLESNLMSAGPGGAGQLGVNKLQAVEDKADEAERNAPSVVEKVGAWFGNLFGGGGGEEEKKEEKKPLVPGAKKKPEKPGRGHRKEQQIHSVHASVHLEGELKMKKTFFDHEMAIPANDSYILRVSSRFTPNGTDVAFYADQYTRSLLHFELSNRGAELRLGPGQGVLSMFKEGESSLLTTPADSAVSSARSTQSISGVRGTQGGSIRSHQSTMMNRSSMRRSAVAGPPISFETPEAVALLDFVSSSYSERATTPKAPPNVVNNRYLARWNHENVAYFLPNQPLVNLACFDFGTNKPYFRLQNVQFNPKLANYQILEPGCCACGSGPSFEEIEDERHSRTWLFHCAIVDCGSQYFDFDDQYGQRQQFPVIGQLVCCNDVETRVDDPLLNEDYLRTLMSVEAKRLQKMHCMRKTGYEMHVALEDPTDGNCAAACTFFALYLLLRCQQW